MTSINHWRSVVKNTLILATNSQACTTANIITYIYGEHWAALKDIDGQMILIQECYEKDIFPQTLLS